MPKISAGILLYRIKEGEPEVFLVHPGGPFFRKKDEGSWTIPKGLPEQGEELLTAAKREFEEEVGFAPEGDFHLLGSVKQKGGKIVHAWAVEYKGKDEIEVSPNAFEMEWPPKSGKMQSFPEIDKGRFFNPEDACRKINPAQVSFIKYIKERFEK